MDETIFQIPINENVLNRRPNLVTILDRYGPNQTANATLFALLEDPAKADGLHYQMSWVVRLADQFCVVNYEALASSNSTTARPLDVLDTDRTHRPRDLICPSRSPGLPPLPPNAHHVALAPQAL